MSGSEQGGAGTTEPRVMSSPSHGMGGARSASPAKRSAADMESAGGRGAAALRATQPPRVPGSFRHMDDEGPTDFDLAADAMAASMKNGADAHDTVADSLDTSTRDTISPNTSATSLQSDEPPPPQLSDDERWRKGSSLTSGNTAPSIDEQEGEVRELVATEPIDEGTRGFLVSTKWLQRVVSRSTEGLKNQEYPKEAREGPIGSIDNSDIVPEGGLRSRLKDDANQRFVPLKPGLAMGQDFEVLPGKAWGKICEWYPPSPTGPQQQVVRYAHNTADPPLQNIQYELYPPVFTVRKVPQPGAQETERPPSSTRSLEELRLRDERHARGQNSPDDAIRFVSSRSEKFQKFLARAKSAAGIPRSTKVRVWKLLNPRNVTVDRASDDGVERRPGVLSPPASRSTSPVKAGETADTKLVLPLPDFRELNVGVELEHVDVRDETNNDKYNGNSTMETYALFEDVTLVLEEQVGGPASGELPTDGKKSSRFILKRPGSKPASTPASGRTSPTLGSVLTRGRARRDGRTRGTVGLTNLGNTCYMNSALQCIRSVEELALYFLSGRYKSEINSGNPLGYGGAMAKQYANLLQQIYGDSTGGAVTPSAFKKTLGASQPMFSGYGQQDSQEFLSFLVDALHEDLNRILKKPYNENPDSDDRTVHDPQAIIKLGKVYQANHRARNDSIAMDLFSGFYKNTMECPVCDKVSVTFDPYSLLTVQLPIENTVQHQITFVPFIGAPIIHNIDIDKNATVGTLKQTIAGKHPGVAANKLWMIEVYNHKIYKVFDNQQTLAEASIQPNDYIFVFELQDVPTNLPEPSKKSYYSYSLSRANDEIPGMNSPKADRFAVPVLSRERSHNGIGWDTIMHPLYITVTREEARDFQIIQKKVLLAVAQQSSRPILAELDAGRKKAKSTQTTTTKTTSTDGDGEKGDDAGDDAAQVSDRSVPSEDGYVNVSVEEAGGGVPLRQSANDDAGEEMEQDGPRLPPNFFDPQYVVSDALCRQLLALNCARSANDGGMLCASISSIDEKSVRSMSERVKPPERRPSLQSSSSEESATSADSAQVNGDADEESDADDDEEEEGRRGEDDDEDGENRPDLVIGGSGDPLSLATPSIAGPGTDDESDNLLQGKSRGGRRKRNSKQNKFAGKGRRSTQVTYSRRDRVGRGARQARPGSSASLYSTQSQRSLGGKPQRYDDSRDDGDTFYIKLGEAIVLDWSPEALDGLFGGDPKVSDDMRGHWLSSNDGRGLNVLHDPVLEARKERRALRKRHGVTLEDCFAETGKREILSEDNAWYCSRCKEMRQAAKTLEIWTIPDILIVHLKRFGGNRSFRDKIDVLVDYPIEGLDMTEKIGLKEDGKDYVYDLFAVDNHYGGLGGGHYTALAKSFYDGQWYDYNDSTCSKIGEQKLHSTAAYLLFYRRRSNKPLGPKYLQDIVAEARNPPPSEAADDDEDGESGEGRLGGPISSLHGSPSAFGAGAGTTASLRSSGNGGEAGAGNRPTTRQTMMSLSDDELRVGEPESPLGMRDGRPILGPLRPANLQFGDQGSSWNFGTLDAPDGTDTDRLSTNVESNNEPDDHNSTAADADSTLGGSLDDRMDDFNYEDARENTPLDDMSIDDDSKLYSSAQEQHQDVDADMLHLEDTSMTGDDAPSPPAAEIRLDDTGDESGGNVHTKVD